MPAMVTLLGMFVCQPYHLGHADTDSVGLFSIINLARGYGFFEQKRSIANRWDRLHFGHPSGRRFDMAKKFAIHVAAMMAEDLAGCECARCSGWRRKALAGAPVHVGLPSVL